MPKKWTYEELSKLAPLASELFEKIKIELGSIILGISISVDKKSNQPVFVVALEKAPDKMPDISEIRGYKVKYEARGPAKLK